MEKSNQPTILTLNHSNKISIVNMDEILLLEATGNYTTFYLNDNSRIVVAKTMKKYESVLNKEFIRVHRSHIVNLRHVKEFSYRDGGVITMKDQTSIAVSRRRVAPFLEHLKKLA